MTEEEEGGMGTETYVGAEETRVGGMYVVAAEEMLEAEDCT